MRYHIVKPEDTIDAILNKYGITYQQYINLNGDKITKRLLVGEKIKIGDIRVSKDTLDYNINNLYERNIYNDSNEQKYICPHCKNIIIIPK